MKFKCYWNTSILSPLIILIPLVHFAITESLAQPLSKKANERNASSAVTEVSRAPIKKCPGMAHEDGHGSAMEKMFRYIYGEGREPRVEHCRKGTFEFNGMQYELGCKGEWRKITNQFSGAGDASSTHKKYFVNEQKP